MSKIYDGLDPTQLEAVRHGTGPLLIVAGPGSGKTAVITHRIAHLIYTAKVKPDNILATTFTNKAAEEMRTRLLSLIDWPAKRVWIGTVHGTCARLLRDCGPQRVGLGDKYTIYDPSKAGSVLGRVIKDLQPLAFKEAKTIDDREALEDLGAASVQELIAEAKEKGFHPHEFAKLHREGRLIERYYREYDLRLRESNAADFGDLQLLAVDLLREHADVRQAVQKRFQWVLVDEFQDTNDIQADLFQLVAGGTKNITAVGDLDQCIPEGEVVSTPKGPRRIETIKTGDYVLAVAGKEIIPARVVKRSSTQAHSMVLRFTTASGRVFRCTPNHIVYVAQTSRIGGYYVYLMRKSGVGWRIGSTSGGLLASQNATLTRASIESAERMWILDHVQDKAKARFRELELSLKYQIPTVPFIRRADEQLTSSDRLALFQKFSNGDKILHDFGISFERPAYLAKATAGSRVAVNVVQAAGRGYSEVLVESTTLPTKFCTKWGASLSNREGYRRLRRYSMSYPQAKTWAQEMVADLESAGVVAYLSERLGIGRRPASTRPIDAAQLQAGMFVVIDKNGTPSHDIVVKREEECTRSPCYDLEIEGLANYFVGGVCVHNSIYSFRYANPSNIRHFDQEWPDSTTILMGTNYRSTPNIVQAASTVIASNEDRFPLEFNTVRPEGAPVKIARCRTEEDAALMAARIALAHYSEDKIPLSEIAVLYRYNRASRALESAFRLRGIPYAVVGGVPFYERREIADLLAWLGLMANPFDVEAFARASRIPPRGVGGTTVDVLRKFAEERKLSMIDAARQITGLKKAQQQGLELVVSLWDSFRVQADDPALLFNIVDTIKYVDFLRGEEDDIENRLLNIRELVNTYNGFCQQVVTLRDAETNQIPEEGDALIDVVRFQRMVELDDTKDRPRPTAVEMFMENITLQKTEMAADKADTDKVRLSSIHSAKGTEFKVVIVAGCEQGTLPSFRSQGSDEALEEERRVFYVAMTRAKDYLYLLHTREGVVFRKRGPTRIEMEPSRFLFEALSGSAVEATNADLPRPPEFRPIRIVSKGKVVS